MQSRRKTELAKVEEGTSTELRKLLVARVAPLVKHIRNFARREESGRPNNADRAFGNIVLEPQPGGRVSGTLLSFVAVVLIPLAAILYYFTFVASDQYIAEARFAVRSLAEGVKSDDAEGSVLTMNAAGQDTYIVTSFIQSPELLRRIGLTVDYRAIFDREGVDFLSRFRISEPQEEFLAYWQRHVFTYIDGPSGIVTLRVQTFRPDDSKLLAEAIVRESEALINELNKRAQEDLIKSIRVEVERTAINYSETLNALREFQAKAGLVNPGMQAQSTSQLLTQLLGQKLEVESRMFVLSQSESQTSPAYENLARMQKSLNEQVAGLRASLTGEESGAVTSAILGYSKLETSRLIAEKLYETSRKSYDSAITASLRKALYLMVFVAPSMPEESLYPRRLSTPLIAGLGLLMFWATMVLVWASIEDHRL
ncbi:capsule biosynthesis protein [Ensifer sp. ENS10]|uniref:capsule biosynthesis protein n=1 Tax=Ensifer sp. ENS10 TaxID=2769286 RepID=UPI001781AA0F|nr:capsule biosynthesis protein [Ensifer sp. ENS10]MBD9510550.1 capsule biosynthesis protein [Ensifer sp. ENS10]